MRKEKPRECGVLETKEVKEASGNDHMLVTKPFLRQNHLQLTWDQVELHILHKLEFQPALMFSEPMLHPLGISGHLRRFMNAVDLSFRKMRSDTHKTADGCWAFPETVKSIPEVRFITNPHLTPKRPSHGVNQTVSM